MASTAKDYYIEKADSITKKASDEKRALTKAEKATVEDALGQIQALSDNAAWLAGDLGAIPKDRLAEILTERADRQALVDQFHEFSKGVNSGAGGFAGAIISGGWSLKGQPKVVVPLESALKANVFPSAETYDVRATGSIADQGADRRWLYPRIPRVTVTDETAISDFVASARALTGTAIRALDATSAKADVAVTLTAVLVELQQAAVVTSGIPNSVLESLPSAREFFNNELRYQIETAIDAAAYAAIVSGAGSGGSGADLISRVRNGVADLRDAGFNPNVLVVDSATGADLDLSQHGSQYIFPLRDSGSSSPLWNLTVIESVAAAGDDPLLIDTSAIGTLYLGQVRIDADPYAGAGGDNFVKNLTDLRAEATVKMHVRRAAAALVLDES